MYGIEAMGCMMYGDIPGLGNVMRNWSAAGHRIGFTNRTGLSNCPNCAAPVQASYCLHCGTSFIVQYQRFAENYDICPICGSMIDPDVLEGNDTLISVYHRCNRCGWQP